MADPNSYNNLDLSFDDLPMIGDLLDNPGGDLKKPPDPGDPPTKDHLKQEHVENDFVSEYILGTLIVRVVAARDLESVGPSGLGKLFFGGGGDSRSVGGGGGASRQSSGSANPYASVRFGTTTQRTSEVFDTVDPIWPRGETMYMDVIHRSGDSFSSTTTSSASTTASTEQGGAGGGKSTVSPFDPPASAASKKSSYFPENAGKSDPTIVQNGPLEKESLPKPILTVAVFHAAEIGRLHKVLPSKSPMAGDSDDRFLGMTAIDLTHLLTGNIRILDEWLPLSGSNSDRASIRIVCEYEPSDGEPQIGDLVRFTNYCHPADLYPLHHGKLYTVEECDGDDLLISHTSQEGWVSTFSVHRFMVICEERRHGAIDVCHDELTSIKHRIANSPLVSVVQDSVERVPEEGLIGLGVDAVQGGASLLTRWIEGGFGTALDDLAMATNWDGRFNPDATTALSTTSLEEHEEKVAIGSFTPKKNEDPSADGVDPLPNMPPCPITGEPMRDPVVAADGHTYERTAIARWLNTSDKSPLTGSVLPHKNLVPNYMLLSSLQEAAKEENPSVTEEEAKEAEGTAKEAEVTAAVILDEDEATSDVEIDD